MPKMYPFRCTEQQLQESLDRITGSGDTVVHAVFKGGRDWMLFCEPDQRIGAGQRVRQAVESGVREGSRAGGRAGRA